MYGILSKTAVCFDGEWYEVWVGVAASFVLFSSLGGVVGGRCGVGGSSCLGHGVDDTDVDEVGGCLVVADDVESGLFVLCCAGVSVKFEI